MTGSPLQFPRGKEIIYGLHEVSSTLCNEVFDLRLSGVLNENRELSESDNAREFLVSNYERIASATRLMAAATDLLATALINGEISIISADEI